MTADSRDTAIREALKVGQDLELGRDPTNVPSWEPAFAALDSLRADLGRVTRKRDDWNRTSLETAHDLQDTLADLTAATEALRHYANEDHWTIEVAPTETDMDTWTYDGGESLPWSVARACLDQIDRASLAEGET